MTDTYVLGQPVPLSFLTMNAAGELAAPDTAVLTITLPSGLQETPTLDVDADGSAFTLDYLPATVGRYVAAFVSTGPAAGAAVDVFDVLDSELAHVTLADVQAYLGDTSHGSDAITQALAAETSAQASRCRVDNYTPALREALLRRVARNLALRSNPLGIIANDADMTSMRVGGTDPEVRRLEGPYRRMVVG